MSEREELMLAEDGQANECRHDSATGIDTTEVTDPAKVWRCDHCGFRWRVDGRTLSVETPRVPACESDLSPGLVAGIEKSRWLAAHDARIREEALKPVRELVEQAERGEGIVLFPGHSTYYTVETGLLRAVIDTPAQADGHRSLTDLIGGARVMFWMCPVLEHGDRRGVVTVEWDGDIAHCTFPGCEHTSAPAQADGEATT